MASSKGKVGVKSIKDIDRMQYLLVLNLSRDLSWPLQLLLYDNDQSRILIKLQCLLLTSAYQPVKENIVYAVIR